MKTVFSCLALLMPILTWAQYQPSPEQNTTMQAVVEAYNAEDYKGMKKPWGLLGQIIVRPKALEKEFSPLFAKYGKAEIAAISCSSIYQCTALLRHEKDARKRTYLSFIFSDRAKLQGFGTGFPIYLYPKATDPNLQATTAEQKTSLIDSLVQAYPVPSGEKRFNGCILVTEGQTTIYQNCKGLANIEQHTPLTNDTRFLLASCSKQFTAMAILLLQKDGLLNVQQPVSDFIPNFPYENITIEHLLTHTSGLPDYMNLLKEHWDKNAFATNADVARILSEQQPKLLFQPNKAFKYSNTGYVVLAHLIEATSGQSYGTFLKEHVFDPLGMNNTIVIARRKDQTVPANYALGYIHNEGKLILPDSAAKYDYVIYQDAITGDDGVSSTTADLHIWNQALNAHALLSPEAMKPAQTEHKLSDGQTTNYGYGLFLAGDEKIEKLSYHTGYWPGYITINMNFPDRNISVIMLSNHSYTNALLLADQVAAVALR